jgi:ferredoxin
MSIILTRLIADQTGALLEFVQDIEAVGIEEVRKSWPDLYPTYLRAKAVLKRAVQQCSLCQCDNCHHVCPTADLKVPLEATPDLDKRLDPGGEVPAGECNKCEEHALTYLLRQENV